MGKLTVDRIVKSFIKMNEQLDKVVADCTITENEQERLRSEADSKMQEAAYERNRALTIKRKISDLIAQEGD